jgi:hypothetical protein
VGARGPHAGRCSGSAGAGPIRRLTKRDVEALLGSYDADPVGALTTALRSTLERPLATWDELVADPAFDTAERVALRERQTPALDALAARLNEERQLSSGATHRVDDGA